jgi:antitoxin HicB
MLKYPGIVHNDPDGLWVEFPGLEISGTQGEDMEDLIWMAEDCLGGYLQLLIEEGREIPEPLEIERENVVWINVPPDVSIPIMLKKHRQELNLTQGELAERIPAPYQTIQKIERGKNIPSLKTLNRIARALGKHLILEISA